MRLYTADQLRLSVKLVKLHVARVLVPGASTRPLRRR